MIQNVSMDVNSWEVTLVEQRVKLFLRFETISSELNLNFGLRTGNTPNPKWGASLILKVHKANDSKKYSKTFFA